VRYGSSKPTVVAQGNRIGLPIEHLSRVRYAFAVLAVLLAVLLRLPFSTVLGLTVPFLTFFPAVIASAWVGGVGPGLLTTVLSALTAELLYVDPVWSIRIERAADAIGLALFLCVGAFISWVTGKLRASEEREQRLRIVAEQTLASIGDAVITTDANGNVTFLNAVAESLTGWAQKDASGTPLEEVFRIVNEETKAAVENPALRALREGTVQGLANHTELISRDGRSTPIDDSAAPIISSGEIVGAVLVFRDISQRHERERAIAESREKLQTTLESITDALITIDAKWCHTYVNPAAERILGKSAAELLGKQHWEEYPDARGTIVETSFTAAVREKKPVHFENYYAPLGRWFDVNVYPAGDGGVSVYFRDITGRKDAEALARETEEQLRLLADANIIGIVFCDVHGKVRDANDEYLRIIGYTREDLAAGRVRWTDVTSPEWLDLDGKKLAEAQQTGRCAPYEKEYTQPDGTRVPVYVGFVLFGVRRESAIAFVVDLSTQKRAEAALRNSEALLRRTNEDLQQFTYAASHDLKEPLRTVRSYVQLLERRYQEQLDETGREFIRFTVEGVKRMQQLIDALLEYSRAGEARQGTKAKVQLEHALETSLSGLRAAVEETAAIVTHDALPEIEADPLLLTQVLQNLLTNAIKYAKQTEVPRAHVSCRIERGSWVVKVTDTGEGIAPEHHDRIFGVFQRLHGQEISGTGIGLATCKKIVEGWGGKIWVESQVGQGATFFFTIPITSEQSLQASTAF
jgi:PAS domain S-box-containing protein